MHQARGNISHFAILINIQNPRHHPGAAKSRQFRDAVARCDDVSRRDQGAPADVLENAQNAPLEADLVRELQSDGILAAGYAVACALRPQIELRPGWRR